MNWSWYNNFFITPLWISIIIESIEIIFVKYFILYYRLFSYVHSPLYNLAVWKDSSFLFRVDCPYFLTRLSNWRSIIDLDFRKFLLLDILGEVDEVFRPFWIWRIEFIFIMRDLGWVLILELSFLVGCKHAKDNYLPSFFVAFMTEAFWLFRWFIQLIFLAKICNAWLFDIVEIFIIFNALRHLSLPNLKITFTFNLWLLFSLLLALSLQA